MAKLLGTNVGIIQQHLSILLKDESIEVRKCRYEAKKNLRSHICVLYLASINANCLCLGIRGPNS